MWNLPEVLDFHNLRRLYSSCFGRDLVSGLGRDLLPGCAILDKRDRPFKELLFEVILPDLISIGVE